MGPPGRTSLLPLRQTLRASISPRVLPSISYRLPQPVQSDVQPAFSVLRCVPASAKPPSARALQSVYSSRKKGEVVRRVEVSAMDVSGVGSAPMSHNAGVSPSASSAIQFLTLCQRLKVRIFGLICISCVRNKNYFRDSASDLVCNLCALKSFFLQGQCAHNRHYRHDLFFKSRDSIFLLQAGIKFVDLTSIGHRIGCCPSLFFLYRECQDVEQVDVWSNFSTL